MQQWSCTDSFLNLLHFPMLRNMKMCLPTAFFSYKLIDKQRRDAHMPSTAWFVVGPKVDQSALCAYQDYKNGRRISHQINELTSCHCCLHENSSRWRKSTLRPKKHLSVPVMLMYTPGLTYHDLPLSFPYVFYYTVSTFPFSLICLSFCFSLTSTDTNTG